MNIKIGARIRNLRILANITQEKLANHLGVSVQAVSRWESEICYPDLELIPAIAKYFGVTTDHILCTDLETIKPIEDKYKEEWRLAYNSGHTQDALEIINEAMIVMPNNFEFMLMKATTLLCFYEHSCNVTRVSEGDRLLRSIIELLEIINDHCGNEAIRCKARILKINLDARLNNSELVLESAEELPSVSDAKNAVLSTVYRWNDEEQAEFSREYIHELSVELIKTAVLLARNNSIPDIQKIEILKSAVKCVSVFAGQNNVGEFELLLEDIYEMLYCFTGEDEYKDHIGIHKKNYDAIKGYHVYTSPFLENIMYVKDDRSIALFDIK